MPSSDPQAIRGSWATLLLPLQDDESIDYGLLADEIDFYSAQRVSGIYSNGTAGEFYSQTEAEFDRVNGLLAEKCGVARTPFQIGLCHPSAQVARERLRRTRPLRPVAYQVILPDWFPPSLAEVMSFLEAMAAAAAPIPLVIYNPAHAKRRLTPPEWLEITGRIPGIAGVKLPGGDEAWYAAMRPVMQRCSVFIPGHFLDVGLRQGALGAYSNVACLSPGGAQRWYELCQSNPAAGHEFGQRVRAFWTATILPLVTERGWSNMAVDKALAVAGGWLAGLTSRLRWPYASMGVGATDRIGAAARRALPELFA